MAAPGDCAIHNESRARCEIDFQIEHAAYRERFISITYEVFNGWSCDFCPASNPSGWSDIVPRQSGKVLQEEVTCLEKVESTR
jgi:hypothetical protein